jgi:hypothetical protein
MKAMKKIKIMMSIVMLVTVMFMTVNAQTNPPFPEAEWVCSETNDGTVCGWMEHPFIANPGWEYPPAGVDNGSKEPASLEDTGWLKGITGWILYD